MKDVAAKVAALRSAGEVRSLASTLLGAPLGPAPRRVHLAALTSDLHTIRIRPTTPKSAADFFLLQLGRARCAGVLTTGAILRAETTLQHGLVGPEAAALAAYRAEEGLGLLRVLVLTRGSHLPPRHPVWAAAPQPVVLTASDAVDALRARLPERVEVGGSPAPSLPEALERLGRGSVVLEAGPRTLAPLYAAGDPPEELILSQYLGPLDPTLRGPAPFAAADLERHFTLRGQTEVEEPSGPWRFSLRVRRGSSRGWRSPPSGSA
jgi:riboflavin biosynthesis pyrimidine reductase